MCTTPGKQEEAESSLVLGEPKHLPTQPSRGTAVRTHGPLKDPGEHAPGRVGKQKGSLGFQKAVVTGGSGERQEGGTAYKSGLGHGGAVCSVQADGGTPAAPAFVAACSPPNNRPGPPLLGTGVQAESRSDEGHPPAVGNGALAVGFRSR